MIKATYTNGQIIPEEPIDFVEGQSLLIEPLPLNAGQTGDQPIRAMREQDWPTTPEGIEALLARWDTHQPLEMTPEEEADIEAWRAKIKGHTIENMDKGIEDLFK